MEIVIKNPNSRVLIDRADNGIILNDVSEDGTVASRSCFEFYDRDGNLDFDNVAIFFFELMEVMKFPVQDPEYRIVIELEKIDGTPSDDDTSEQE